MRKDQLSETEVSAKVAELGRFWFAVFAPLDWSDRLDLLQSIDGEIACDLRSRDLAQVISRRFTQKIITLFGDRPVSNRDQAFFYLHSAQESHRAAGKIWLRLTTDPGWRDGVAALPAPGRYFGGDE